MKTKLKRFLSLFASAAIMATTVTAVTVPAAADSSAVTITSDNFESYASDTISKWSTENYSTLSGNQFYKSSWLSANKSDFTASGDADKLFQITTDSSMGDSKVLKVTTQKNLNSATWLVKPSGITSENINGKTLTFTADFIVPTENEINRGNGVAVYLDSDSNNAPDTKWSFHNATAQVYGSATFKYKTLLNIERDIDGNTNPISVFAFGEKIQEVTPDTKYSYTLTLTPDSTGTGYTAKTVINGTEKDLPGTNLPDANTIAGYKYFMVGAKNNPNQIKISYPETDTDGNTTYDINKYPNDKTVALLDNLSLTAAANAETGDTFFADSFENYGSDEYVPTASSTDVSQYNKDTFSVRSNVSSDARTTSDATKAAEITAGDKNKIAKLVTEKFGGSGKTLQLTSQGIVTRGAMYKKSNITEAALSGKALVYKASFKIDENGPYNNGVGFAAGLSATRVSNGVTEPNVFYHDSNNPITNAMSAGSNSYKLFAAQGLDFWVFGEKMCELQKGVNYNYTLKLVPNEDGETYRAVAQLNDEVKEIKTEVPTIADMAKNQFAFIALHNQGYPTAAGAVGSGYTNDQPLVYIDDITLEKKNPSDVELPKPDTAPTDKELGAYGLFEENFEDYTVDYVKKASADELSRYEKNDFVLNYGAKTADPAQDKLKDGRIVKGDISKLYKVSKGGGFGSGKNYLNVQTQGLIVGGTMWQRSNITYDRIKNKTLVFKAKFKIPSASQWGSGSSAAILFVDSASTSKKPNGAIGSVNNSADDIDSKYCFATISDSTFKVFGENIGAVIDKGKEYDVTVTMIPNSAGKYTVTVKLNDTVKTLEGKKIVNNVETETIPTMAELGTYSFAGIASHANSWNTGSRYDTTNKYLADQDFIYFDDISLTRADSFVLKNIGDLTTEGELDMAKKYITLNLGEAIDTVDETKITIDNDATVKSAVIDTTDSKKLKITFDNLKLNTGYTINIAGVVNPIGVEYSDELSLRTSAGIDVNYENIKLEKDTDGKMKVTVPVTKQTGVTDTVKPAVIVYVYDGSNTDAPLIKKAYAKEEEVTSQKSIEITGIEVEEGDEVRVFVWDGFSSMRPLTKRIDLKQKTV